MHSMDDTFHRLLRKELVELHKETKDKLAKGAWASGKDASQVGMEAMKLIGFLKALEEVEKACDHVAFEMSK